VRLSSRVVSETRLEAYARLLVEHCLDVQPGWEVLVRTQPEGRPLLEEVVRRIARRGAYAVVRLGFTLWPVDWVWAAEAPLELVAELPETDRFASDRMDARITIDAPENTREAVDVPEERQALATKARSYFFRRTMAHEIPWVSCQYPTNALAQEAGLTVRQFEDVLYKAVLVDWHELKERMRRYADHFDAAEEVRIVGPGTDLTLSLAGRHADVDGGEANMPGGEFFYAPVEDSAEGVVEFSEFPSVDEGTEVAGARLVFRDGRVVDAAAATGEEFLLAKLDTDEGARRLGELGIGCNPGITRHMKNTLFDEKMAGTVHLALGASYTHIGGKNESVLHWDLVKDLRRGGELWCDGELVQRNGEWRL
jgi:aminopeptidase